MNGDKKTLWLIGGAVAVIVIIVAVFAVVRNVDLRQMLSGSSPVSEVEGDGLPMGEHESPGETQSNRVICGDRQCASSETIDNCPIDCVDRDMFGGFSVIDLPNGDVAVSWTTSVPMTSVLNYRMSDMSDFARLGGEAMTTEHEVVMSGFDSGIIDFQISGVDENGTERQFGAYGHER